MSKVYNFKTQKGILEHCTDRGETVLPCSDLVEHPPFVGQPATFHIGSDAYADEVVRVDYKKDGTFKQVATKGGARFKVQVSANCRSKGDGGWCHESYLDGINNSGWLELGVAVTRLDPSF